MLTLWLVFLESAFYQLALLYYLYGFSYFCSVYLSEATPMHVILTFLRKFWSLTAIKNKATKS